MTQAEFYQAQKQARNEWLKIVQGVRKDIYKVYLASAEEISLLVENLKLSGRGNSLTAESIRQLEKLLRQEGVKISKTTEDSIINGINDNADITNESHIEYIKDALNLSGIQNIKIDRMYAAINKILIEITYARTNQNGYNFSQSIWGFSGNEVLNSKPSLSQYWQEDIKNIIQIGFSQNRDILQIAKDITYYAANGKIKLMKRYGNLLIGSGKYARRIPKNIDYRAIRIARSELYNSIQEAAKIQGKYNPAITEYIWNLTSGAIHECVCPDLAADSPYTEYTLPDYPHPNCLCYITHMVKSRDEFVDDLIAWENGLNVPYIDSWYRDVYLNSL